MIEIGVLGVTRVAISQPRGATQGERLWQLYRRLRPHIAALERAARAEGPRVAVSEDGGGR